MNKAVSSEQKPLDVICLGRVAVDLYGQQIGSRLEDMTTFAKYLGIVRQCCLRHGHSGITFRYAGPRRR
ncbi:hypothetical protein JRY29_16035 [Salmonella enterica subsp. enterica serovar Kentucky]|nr:hypothetical protein JRY29_16035 [Salmonella enterica subsp. enterica serovar Kentucky]